MKREICGWCNGCSLEIMEVVDGVDGVNEEREEKRVRWCSGSPEILEEMKVVGVWFRRQGTAVETVSLRNSEAARWREARVSGEGERRWCLRPRWPKIMVRGEEDGERVRWSRGMEVFRRLWREKKEEKCPRRGGGVAAKRERRRGEAAAFLLRE
ncbi:hypothetical protein HAX54_042049 [Datura stramonium]|uniref:Uncharacterized protein n=1 Tax=Datura stramonium TaxID=4076 RepID=A0ABS8SLS4_DATST|nr:hypothetical protein [Datura stramonium]